MKPSFVRRMAFPAVCLLAAAIAAGLLAFWSAARQLALLDGFCTALVARAPETADAVYALVKEGTFAGQGAPGVLTELGYRPRDFAAGAGWIFAVAGACLCVGTSLLGGTFFLSRRAAHRQQRQLIDLLEAARTGQPLPLLTGDRMAEGSFARLADEIQKTVTELALTREAAVTARDQFAQNLANIAHQLKTPLTALSLAAQNAGDAGGALAAPLERLTGLEESLLLLARLDAGALPLQPEVTDLYTLLMMAADNLQPLTDSAGVTLDIPELEPLPVTCDPDWTMEALLNLMKNNVEHAPAGSAVRCSCRRNALYTQVVLQDAGSGFAQSDLPHLFERFYRGEHPSPHSTGLGLAIAKELLERQNILVHAENAPEGGGRFVVRFYR